MKESWKPYKPHHDATPSMVLAPDGGDPFRDEPNKGDLSLENVGDFVCFMSSTNIHLKPSDLKDRIMMNAGKGEIGALEGLGKGRGRGQGSSSSSITAYDLYQPKVYDTSTFKTSTKRTIVPGGRIVCTSSAPYGADTVDKVITKYYSSQNTSTMLASLNKIMEIAQQPSQGVCEVEVVHNLQRITNLSASSHGDTKGLRGLVYALLSQPAADPVSPAVSGTDEGPTSPASLPHSPLALFDPSPFVSDSETIVIAFCHLKNSLCDFLPASFDLAEASKSHFDNAREGKEMGYYLLVSLG